MRYSYIVNEIILIGGAPTAGKSYTAQWLARELGYSWIGTDTLHAQMLKIVRRAEHPDIFKFAKATPEMAEPYLTNNSAQQIVDDQNRVNRGVWPFVKALIEELRSQQPFVIEGVALLPEQVSQLPLGKGEITPFYLVNTNIHQLRDTIRKRGLWTHADKYPDHVKEKELEWVLLYNEYIRDEAAKYNLQTLDVDTGRTKYLKEIKRRVSNPPPRDMLGVLTNTSKHLARDVAGIIKAGFSSICSL